MAWAAANLYEGDGTKSAQCSASSEHTTYVAENAFDAAAGGVDDCWISDDSNTPETDGSCYLEFNFTTTMYIGGLQIQRRTSAAGEMTNYPKDIVVKAKRTADVDWTTVKTATLTSPADGAWGDEVAFAPIYASHWDVLRIEFHSVHYRGTVGWNVCVKEVRFLGREKCGPLTVAYRADLDGTIVPEQTGTQNDYGYIGVSGEAESSIVFDFAVGYREHDRYGDSCTITFTWNSAGYLKVDNPIYSDTCAGYLQAVFDPAAINGLYIAYKWYHNTTAYSDTHLRIHDGAYDYTSLVDYPQDLAPVSKGAGVVQTIASQTASEGNVTKSGVTLLDLATATLSSVTLRFEHLKNYASGGGPTYSNVYYFLLSNLGVIDVFRGEAALPITSFLGSTVDFSGEVSLPTFSIDAVCEGGIGYVALPCPLPEQVTNVIDITAGFSLEATGYRPLLGEAELPVPIAAGVVGGTQLADLPTGDITGVCIVGFVSVGDEELPAPLVEGFAGGDGRAVLPVGDVAGEGYAGALARGACFLPVPEVAGSGAASQMFTGEAWLPLVGVTGTWPACSWFRGNAVIGFALSAVGKAGITVIGEAVIDFSLIAEGDVACLGVMNAALPLPMVQGICSQAAESRTELLKFHRGF